jgi:hypothetical protein
MIMSKPPLTLHGGSEQAANPDPKKEPGQKYLCSLDIQQAILNSV